MGMPLAEIVQKLEAFAPLKLSEPWDNVGLVIEPSANALVSTILLAIDITEDVVDEAIDNNAKLIVCYHPNIFKPLKTINQSNWKERTILKCIKNDIAVFISHTTWDPIEHGIDEWLTKAFDAESVVDIENKAFPEDTHGVGKFVTLNKAISLKNAVTLIKTHVGIPFVRVGIARHRHLESPVRTVAICAGCGTAALSGGKADLFVTGEMLHDEVLETTQSGMNVILCNHSDSERGFLNVFREAFRDERLNIIVSKVDKDCLLTM